MREASSVSMPQTKYGIRLSLSFKTKMIGFDFHSDLISPTQEAPYSSIVEVQPRTNYIHTGFAVQSTSVSTTTNMAHGNMNCFLDVLIQGCVSSVI